MWVHNVRMYNEQENLVWSSRVQVSTQLELSISKNIPLTQNNIWHPHLEKAIVTAGVWVGFCPIQEWQSLFQMTQIYVCCGIARRGCAFLPRRSLECCLDSSVRFRLRCPRFNTLPPGVSVFGDILRCTQISKSWNYRWPNGLFSPPDVVSED